MSVHLPQQFAIGISRRSRGFWNLSVAALSMGNQVNPRRQIVRRGGTAYLTLIAVNLREKCHPANERSAPLFDTNRWFRTRLCDSPGTFDGCRLCFQCQRQQQSVPAAQGGEVDLRMITASRILSISNLGRRDHPDVCFPQGDGPVTDAGAGAEVVRDGKHPSRVPGLPSTRPKKGCVELGQQTSPSFSAISSPALPPYRWFR